MFQDHCLLPQCSVLENVLVPTLVARDGDGGGRWRDARAACVEQVGLGRSHRSSAGRAVGRREAARRDRPRARSGSRGCCCATSRPATSIARRPTTSRRCCSTCTGRSRTILIVVTHSAAARGALPDPLRARRPARCKRVGVERTRMTATTRSSCAAWRYYWRTNLAVVLGVATAVAVLAGALLVGDSVRGSLRDLVLQRLGRDRSGRRLDRLLPRGARRRPRATDPAFARVVRRRRADRRRAGAGHRPGERPPRVAACRSTASTIASGAFTASRRRTGPAARDALVSPALAARPRRRRPAARCSSASQRPSAIPLESLHGRKDDLGRTLRLTVRAVLARRPSSASSRCGRSRATCAPCSCRWRGCSRSSRSSGRVNALLVAATARRAGRRLGRRRSSALVSAARRRSKTSG